MSGYKAAVKHIVAVFALAFLTGMLNLKVGPLEMTAADLRVLTDAGFVAVASFLILYLTPLTTAYGVGAKPSVDPKREATAAAFTANLARVPDYPAGLIPQQNTSVTDAGLNIQAEPIPFPNHRDASQPDPTPPTAA